MDTGGAEAAVAVVNELGSFWLALKKQRQENGDDDKVKKSTNQPKTQSNEV